MAELPEELLRLVEELDWAYVATASEDGLPHLAVERGLTVDEDDLVFNSWFCPKTTKNLTENSDIVVVLWDEENEEGYQVEGEKKTLKKVATLDGYSSEVDQEKFPQTEYRLQLDVKSIYEFSPGPHSDKPTQDL